jgi:putative ABC transport system substrate-binding protein
LPTGSSCRCPSSKKDQGQQPGGNVTGFAAFEATLGGKWLELLSEITPGLKQAAIMFNPDTPPISAYMPSFETAAQLLKVMPIIAPVHSDEEIEAGIIALGREPGGGLVAIPDIFTAVHRAPIILAAARNNLPAIYRYSSSARGRAAVSGRAAAHPGDEVIRDLWSKVGDGMKG